MIKAVIIDDEKDARFILRNLIERKFESKLTVTGEANDVRPGIDLIKAEKPDVVFLDVQMKNGTGFDVLKQIKDIDFEVIFITAYNEFAIEAFKFSAFGYLLKPIKLSELEAVVEKLEGQLELKNRDLDKKVKVLVENYGANGEIQKLIISNIEGFQVLTIDMILRLEGDRNYSHFILANGRKVTTSKSLREYEELLLEYGFFRIHQSTIVSLRHITGYIRGDGGYVEMLDGSRHKVSRNRKNDFLARFN